MISEHKIYDLIGIGLGPFNLGLAALLQDHSQINYLFLEQQTAFDWHPGLLLPWARMQVPYYADLVTPANPKSHFSYMNYLHVHNQMFRFGAHEDLFPLRTEYNKYCKWVVSLLPSLLFNRQCINVSYNTKEKYYIVETTNTINNTLEMFHAKHLVIGTGTIPHIPSTIQFEKHQNILHASEYLKYKNTLLSQSDVAIIGSGQSAAEIFYDLLQHENLLRSLNWYTRSRRIQPMDYSRFALEMSCPDYVDYFYELPETSKTDLVTSQQYLYKGINQDLITQIHNQLYYMNSCESKLKPGIYTASELKRITKAGKELSLTFRHKDKHIGFNKRCRSVILATGYEYKRPPFLKKINKYLCLTTDGDFKIRRNYSIDVNQTVFVQNADLYTHGFNAADLGMGAHRNAIILNTILKQEYYGTERNTAFQTFGTPV